MLTILWVALLGFDFEEVTMIAMGFAGLAYVIVDQKRERELDRRASEFAERIARLEAYADDPTEIERRVARLEIEAERDERFEERLAGYGERIATLEALTKDDEGTDDDGNEESSRD